MIAFLDKDVFSVDKSWATKKNILSFYSAEEHSKDILTVYDNDKYFGMICFQSVSKCLRHETEGDEGYIIKESYVHNPNDESIWINLHELLSNNKVPYIPIFNQDDCLLYFAYEDTNEIKEGMRNIFEGIKKSIDFLTIKGVKGVRIYHLNELGFLCWKLFQHNREVDVETIGEKWRVLFPESKANLCGIPEDNVLEYYPYTNPQMFFFKKELLTISRVRSLVLMDIVEDYVEKLRTKGIKILRAYFSGAVKRITLDEEFRQTKAINPCMGKDKWNMPLIHEQICKVVGQEISYEEWCEENAKKKWDYIKIDGKLIFNKKFGEVEGRKAKDNIYIIGPCIAEGEHVRRFEESLGGCIWKKINERGYTYTVSCIGLDMNDILYYKIIFDNLLITENDIILLVLPLDLGAAGDAKSDIPVIEMMKKRTGDWFWDCPVHTTFEGNMALANKIVNEYIEPLCRERKEAPEYLQVGKEFLSSAENDLLKKYIEKIKAEKYISRGKHIGAIVMNCNPMTKGHRYLIEEARKCVDYLYIFVVEEDKSAFAFKDRFSIVKEETKQMENVIVVPSGQFILSYTTMPLYFEKEEKKNAALDAANDLRIFGQYVASALGIKERFVGEEPIDMVTRQYNEEMKEILPLYNIKVTEIPRLKVDNVEISASRVRQFMKEGKWDEIRSMVTETVYDRLKMQ